MGSGASFNLWETLKISFNLANFLMRDFVTFMFSFNFRFSSGKPQQRASYKALGAGGGSKGVFEIALGRPFDFCHGGRWKGIDRAAVNRFRKKAATTSLPFARLWTQSNLVRVAAEGFDFLLGSGIDPRTAGGRGGPTWLRASPAAGSSMSRVHLGQRVKRFDKSVSFIVGGSSGLGGLAGIEVRPGAWRARSDAVMKVRGSSVSSGTWALFA